MNKLPELILRGGGSSSSELQICAIPGQSFNCVEFSTKEDAPQPILVAPWIQFESSAMADWRHTMASEVLRRAVAYDAAVAGAEHIRQREEGWRNGVDRANLRNEQLLGMLTDLVERRADGRCYIRHEKGTDVTELLNYFGGAA